MNKKTFDRERHLKDVERFLCDEYVVVYTDGSCSWKTGQGGYGVFLKYEVSEKKISVGPVFNTTISRMEMSAILEALVVTKKKYKVVIFSDSQYSVNTINIWHKDWPDLDYRPNADLIKDILSEIKKFEKAPLIKWIPGHCDIEGNDMADALADEGRKIFLNDKKKKGKKK